MEIKKILIGSGNSFQQIKQPGQVQSSMAGGLGESHSRVKRPQSFSLVARDQRPAAGAKGNKAKST